MRQVITSLFSECVAVASVSVYRLEGGSVGAVVKVNLKTYSSIFTLQSSRGNSFLLSCMTK